ncbi:hypothetical protein P6166_12195 [Stenotrophomonas sp. HITSZ_GD]|uniref:hypothetical protein n=1 Tax=Stenotrophomonas sp. HITSZ_GD TaxID=3037248 RepID=UPI00240D4566|nr:hypothetical protein [Stenotrophomonas sp. HITSZ_GD]MDG2526116.1 hypothetical protein [Stenotrophomonas sp. HITSZ_GD]
MARLFGDEVQHQVAQVAMAERTRAASAAPAAIAQVVEIAAAASAARTEAAGAAPRAAASAMGLMAVRFLVPGIDTEAKPAMAVRAMALAVAGIVVVVVRGVVAVGAEEGGAAARGLGVAIATADTEEGRMHGFRYIVLWCGKDISKYSRCASVALLQPFGRRVHPSRVGRHAGKDAPRREG